MELPFRTITPAELASHNGATGCWVSLHGNVYDVTSFLEEHPGGVRVLLRPGHAGADVTSAFERVGHSASASRHLERLYIGQLVKSQPLSKEAFVEQRSAAPTVVVGRRLDDVEKQDNPVVGVIVGRTRIDDDGEDCQLENAPLTAEAPAATKVKGAHWHAGRRTAILEAHPEVQGLLKPDPWTFVFIPILAATHAGASILAQYSESVFVAVTLAWSLGAFCKMWQFAMAHELCHGTVWATLERASECKAWAMHCCALPAVNSQINDYYSWAHLGHHSSFGEANKNFGEDHGLGGGNKPMQALQTLLLDQGLDGDLVSVNSFKLLARTGKIMERLHRAPYLLLFIVDSGFHLSWGVFLSFWSLQMGLCFPFVLVLWFLWKTGCSQIRTGFWQLDDVLEGSGAGSEVDGELLRSATHVCLHPWLWVGSVALLFWAGPQTKQSFCLELLYLFLSEAFYSGFLLHPYMAFWLGTHGTGKGDFDGGGSSNQDCQPTMSTYSYLSAFLTANLSYHVEHHDFPNCPWRRLPQINAIAPEFYDDLRQSKGLKHTMVEYMKHGNTWTYACIN